MLKLPIKKQLYFCCLLAVSSIFPPAIGRADSVAVVAVPIAPQSGPDISTQRNRLRVLHHHELKSKEIDEEEKP